MAKWRDIRAMLLDVVAQHETSVVFHEKREGFYQTVSYGRLLEDVSALDTVLAARFARDMRVLLLGKDSVMRTTVLLALLCGGYHVVLPTGKNDAAVAAAALRTGAAAVIYDEDNAALAAALAPALPMVAMAELPDAIRAGREAIKAGEAAFFEATLDPQAPVISFCGKVEYSFSMEALLIAIGALTAAQEITEQDIFLSTLPPAAKDAVLMGLLAPLSVGASIAFGEGIDKLMTNLREVHPTTLLTVPYIAERIHDKFFALVAGNGTEAAVRRAIAASDPVRPLAARQALKERLLLTARRPFGGSLRRILTVGGQLPAAKTKGLRQIGVHAAAIYTVPFIAGAVAMTTPQRYLDGTVGAVVKPVAVSLIAPRADGAGEVCLCGKTLALGLTDGRMTGDIARFDAEGNLSLIGRAAHRIVLGGDDFVCPEELEAKLLQSPLVADAAVLLLPQGIGELAALIRPNDAVVEEMLGEAYSEEEVTYALDEWIEEINRSLPAAHRLAHFALLDEDLPRDRLGNLKRNDFGEFLKGF